MPKRKITIQKYPIKMRSTFYIEMPLDSEILCVEKREGYPFVFAVVDEGMEKIRVKFQLVLDGSQEVSTPAFYAGTFSMDLKDVPMTFHLFYDTTSEK